MELNEEILEAWLDLTTAINNDRIVNNMFFNEILIYRILYNNQDKELTATELCQITKIQKSQMNRTLTAMEDKKLIKRIRFKDDKRKILVALDEDNLNVYNHEHQRIISLINKLIDKIGINKSKEVLDIFKLVAKVAKEEIK